MYNILYIIYVMLYIIYVMLYIYIYIYILINTFFISSNLFGEITKINFNSFLQCQFQTSSRYAQQNK